MTKTVVEKSSPITKARANLIRFCKILDDLPVNFNFKLKNISKEFDGSWKKTVSNGAAAWQNGSKLLFNSSFFQKRSQVLEAIEREGLQVRKLYLPDKNPKISSFLTKEKLKELYYRQKKSLQDIADENKCTKQWISLLMAKYGLKERTRSEAVREALKKRQRKDWRMIK